MTPFIIRNINYNSKIRRFQSIHNKKKYRIINKRKISTFQNGPNTPNNLWIFITAALSYYTLNIFRDNNKK